MNRTRAKEPARGRHVAAWILAASILGLVSTLALLELFPAQVVTRDAHAGGTLRVSLDRSVQVLSCPILAWRAEHVEEVWFKGELQPLMGEGSACGRRSVSLRAVYADGTEHTYELACHVVLASRSGRALLVLLLVLGALAGWLGGVVAGPWTMIRSIRASLSRSARGARRWVGRERHGHVPTLLVITAVGVALRVAVLDQPLRLDEATTLRVYAAPPVALGISLGNYRAPNNHLLNTLLMHVALRVFGRMDEWVVRLPALVFGLSIVPLAYLASRRLFGRDCALVTTALVAASSPLILFSANARGYSCVIAAFLALLFLAPSLARGRSPAAWLAFVAVSVTGFFAIPIMLYPFLVVSTWVGLSSFPLRRWAGVRDLAIASGFAGLATILLYSLVLARWGIEGITANAYTAPADAASFVRDLPRNLQRSAALWVSGVPRSVVGLLVLGLVAAPFARPRDGRHRVSMGRVALVVMSATILIQRPDLKFPRLLLFLAPLLAAIASAGLADLVRRVAPGRTHVTIPLLALLLLGAMALQVTRTRSVQRSEATGTLRDARAIVADVSPLLGPGDQLLTPRKGKDSIVWYYLVRRGLDDACLARDIRRARRLFVVTEPGRSVQEILAAYVEEGVSADDFGAPRQLASYESSRLLVLEREPPGG